MWDATETPQPRREQANAWARIARFSARNAVFVGIFWLFLAAAAAVLSVSLFAIDSDPKPSIGVSPQLAADYAELREAFPGLWDPVSAVIESPEPGRAKATAALLVNFLEGRPDLYKEVFAPGSGRFFDDYGLLYLDAAEVERIVQRLEQTAPLYQALSASPDLRGLSELAVQVARAVSEGRSPEGLEGLFSEAARTVKSQIGDRPAALDWPLLVEHTAKLDPQKVYVDAAAVADFTRLDPFARPYAEFDDIARQLQRRSEGAVTIAVAGPQDGFRTDLGRAAILPALVAGVLLSVVLGFGAPRLRVAFAIALSQAVTVAVSAALLTAIAGPWTEAGIISLVLLIVLSAIFGAGAAARYAQETTLGHSPSGALALTGQRFGPVIAMCTAVTIIAFPLFLFAHPAATPRLAIAAVICVCFAALLALTGLPALMRLIPLDPEDQREHWLTLAAAGLAQPFWHWTRMGLAVAMMVAPIAAAPLWLAAGLPGRESAGRSAAIHVLSPPGATARALASELGAIEGVAKVTWIESFLPQEEDRKREILSRLDGLLPVAAAPDQPGEVEALRADFERLLENLKTISNQPGVSPGLAQAAGELRRSLAVFDSPQPAGPGAILTLQSALFDRLDVLLERIDRIGKLAPLTVEALDPAVRRRYVAPDGRWRLEIEPEANANITAAVRAITPDAVSSDLLDAEQAQSSLRNAGIAGAVAGAVLCAAMLLGIRSFRAIAVALPSIAVLAMALWGLFSLFRIPPEPANLLAPAAALLLAASASVSFAMRARDPQGSTGGWTGSVLLAGAICLSPSAALILSAAPGIATLGMLLCVAIGIQLTVSLIVTPQLWLWLGGDDVGA